MTAATEDISSLPGKKVTDQEENPIGEVKEIYAMEGDGHPMWIVVEASFGMSDKRTVFIPLARLKDEDGTLRVPYSKAHIGNTPQVDGSEGISAECDRELRDHYGIDRGDQELRSDNKSYATLVPEEEGTAERVEDADKLDTPNPDKRSDETKSRLHDPGSAETRKATADDVVEEDADEGDEEGDAEGREEGDKKGHAEGEEEGEEEDEKG